MADDSKWILLVFYCVLVQRCVGFPHSQAGYDGQTGTAQCIDLLNGSAQVNCTFESIICSGTKEFYNVQHNYLNNSDDVLQCWCDNTSLRCWSSDLQYTSDHFNLILTVTGKGVGQYKCEHLEERFSCTFPDIQTTTEGEKVVGPTLPTSVKSESAIKQCTCKEAEENKGCAEERGWTTLEVGLVALSTGLFVLLTISVPANIYMYFLRQPVPSKKVHDEEWNSQLPREDTSLFNLRLRTAPRGRPIAGAGVSEGNSLIANNDIQQSNSSHAELVTGYELDFVPGDSVN